jgi:methionine aminopeptidase
MRSSAAYEAADSQGRNGQPPAFSTESYSPPEYVSSGTPTPFKLSEMVVHGVPDSRLLEEGDIINCDVSAIPR